MENYKLRISKPNYNKSKLTKNRLKKRDLKSKKGCLRLKAAHSTASIAGKVSTSAHRSVATFPRHTPARVSPTTTRKRSDPIGNLSDCSIGKLSGSMRARTALNRAFRAWTLGHKIHKVKK